MEGSGSSFLLDIKTLWQEQVPLLLLAIGHGRHFIQKVNTDQKHHHKNRDTYQQASLAPKQEKQEDECKIKDRDLQSLLVQAWKMQVSTEVGIYW